MRRSLIRITSIVTATGFVFACASGGTEKNSADTTATDTSASASAGATTPAETFTMKGTNPDWSVDVAPASHVLWDGPKPGPKDTIQFAYAAPTINGAIREFTVIRMQPDTHRIDITLAQAKCKVGTAEMGWKAQVWVDQKAYSGCADKK